MPENLDAFVRLVIDAYDELDAVVAAIDRAVTEPAHGRSDDGRICVVVQCGMVTDVRVDQRWLVTAPADVRLPGYSWWDVPVSATSKVPGVRAARAAYDWPR